MVLAIHIYNGAIDGAYKVDPEQLDEGKDTLLLFQHDDDRTDVSKIYLGELEVKDLSEFTEHNKDTLVADLFT